MNLVLQRLLPRTLPRAVSTMLWSGREPSKLVRPPVRTFAHICPQTLRLPQIAVKILPALKNNYMYLLIDYAQRVAAAIDPVEPDLIIKALVEEKVELGVILITHHHEDHSWGTTYLIRAFPPGSIPVYGGDTRVHSMTHFFQPDMQLQLGNLTITCLHTPSHTRDHYCLFVEGCEREPHEHVLFSGDCLFQAGCGTFDEGTPENMLDFTHFLRNTLPADTLVFAGHENTITNLQFAKMIEPKNEIIGRRLRWAQKQLADRKPTFPSTLAEECCWNPFMRTQYPSIREFTGGQDDLQAMQILRQRRDKFKPKVKKSKSNWCRKEED